MKTSIIKRLINTKLDKKIKSSILYKYLNSLGFIKHFARNIFKNLAKKFRSLINMGIKSPGVMSLKTLRRKIMKNRKWYLALASLALVASLAACGGGGGGGGPVSGGGFTPPPDPGTPTVIITPTTFSFNCWNGAITSTVAQPTKVDCAAVPTANINVSIVGGALTVTGLPAGVVIKSSTFTAISGASTLVYTNGALTSGTPLSAATYTFTGASLVLGNGPTITLAGSFVTPVIAVTCTAPAMLNTANACVSPPATTGYTWNSIVGGGVWVADVGVLVSGANLLPSTSNVIGDAAWLTAAANGTIKWVKTPSTMTGLNSRPLVYAYYKTTNAPGGNGSTEYYAVTAMYADTVATSAFANQNVGNGSAAVEISQIRGSASGAKLFAPTQGCFERAWDGANFSNTQLGTVGCSI